MSSRSTEETKPDKRKANNIKTKQSKLKQTNIDNAKSKQMHNKCSAVAEMGDRLPQ